MYTAPVSGQPLSKSNPVNNPASAASLPTPQATPSQLNLSPRERSGLTLSSNVPGGASSSSEPQYSGSTPGLPASSPKPLVWDEQQLLASSRALEAGIKGKEAEARDQALVNVFKQFKQVRVNLPKSIGDDHWLTVQETSQATLKKLDLNYIDLVCAPVEDRVRGSDAQTYQFADAASRIWNALEQLNLLGHGEASQLQVGISITAASRCQSRSMLDSAYTTLRNALRNDKLVVRLKIDALQSTKDGTRAEDVLTALKSHPSLQQLQLRNTVIDDAIAADLISLTRTVPNLQCLDLAGNEITAEAREILSRAHQKLAVILPELAQG